MGDAADWEIDRLSGMHDHYHEKQFYDYKKKPKKKKVEKSYDQKMKDALDFIERLNKK
jgi:cytochrome c553